MWFMAEKSDRVPGRRERRECPLLPLPNILSVEVRGRRETGLTGSCVEEYEFWSGLREEEVLRTSMGVTDPEGIVQR